MVKVQATCTDCGNVRFDIEDVTVRICLDSLEESYRFICPACRKPVIKSCVRETADLLIESGAPTEHWTLPSEMYEPRCSTPLTERHVVDLTIELHNATLFEEMRNFRDSFCEEPEFRQLLDEIQQSHRGGS